MLLATITLSTLRSSGRDLVAPFRVLLPDNSVLECSDILRILPGKRIVAKATHNGNAVLAKIFFQIRNLQQETDGYQLLQTTGVKTPALLRTIPFDDGGICLYAFLQDAMPFDVAWKQSGNEKKQQHFLALLDVLQQMSTAKVYQTDLHPGNFLYSGATLFALDPASCARDEKADAIEEALSLLLAQFPPYEWPLVTDSICQKFPAIAADALRKNSGKKWGIRKNNYLEKIFRDCTEVADLSREKLRILCRRDHISDALTARLRDPATLAAGATILKDGQSAKVYLLEVDGKKLVAKHYINKDWSRKIRRSLRPSRAARSWYFSHALNFVGVDVPTPVALIEGGSRWNRDAWFISDYVSGNDLLSHWQQHEPTDREISAIRNLFAALAFARMSHGDMKATNLIASANQLFVIDYDGMQKYHSQSALKKALVRDRERLLRNWNIPALQQTLQKI
jgi:tRNA A-37 threonylcarbamoyl transferase component Bud32